jgi:hypothetical protein
MRKLRRPPSLLRISVLMGSKVDKLLMRLSFRL